jgi:hypothetical protein
VYKRNKAYDRAYHEAHRKEESEYGKRWFRRHPHRSWASARIRGHKARGYVIKISLDELTNMAKHSHRCPYCGVKLDWNMGRKNRSPRLNSPSMDRTDNGKVIKTSTIQIICYLCNITKQHRTHKEFLAYCNKVSKRFARKE